MPNLTKLKVRIYIQRGGAAPKKKRKTKYKKRKRVEAPNFFELIEMKKRSLPPKIEERARDYFIANCLLNHGNSS